MRWQSAILRTTTFRPWEDFDKDVLETAAEAGRIAPVLSDLLEMSPSLLDSTLDVTPLAAAEALLLALEPKHKLSFTHEARVCSEAALAHVPDLGGAPAPLTVRPSMAVYSSRLGAMPVACGIEIGRIDKYDEGFWRAQPDARNVAAEFAALFGDMGLGPKIAGMVERTVAGALVTEAGVGVAVMPAGAVCLRVEDDGVGVMVRVSRVFGGATAAAAVAGLMRLGLRGMGRVGEVRRLALRVANICAREERVGEEVSMLLKGARRIADMGCGWIALRGKWEGREAVSTVWDGGEEGELMEFLRAVRRLKEEGYEVVNENLVLSDSVERWRILLGGSIELKATWE